MPTIALRTDARHENISQDSLNTGYDMNPAYPGHEEAILPTRSRPPIVASSTRVLWRTNGALATAVQSHLLRRNYSLWPRLFQLFSGSSLLLVVVESSWNRQLSSCTFSCTLCTPLKGTSNSCQNSQNLTTYCTDLQPHISPVVNVTCS